MIRFLAQSAFMNPASPVSPGVSLPQQPAGSQTWQNPQGWQPQMTPPQQKHPVLSPPGVLPGPVTLSPQNSGQQNPNAQSLVASPPPPGQPSASAPTSAAWSDFWRKDKNKEAWYEFPRQRPVPTPDEIRVVGINQLPPDLWDYAYHHSPYNTWSPSHEIHHEHPKYF